MCKACFRLTEERKRQTQKEMAEKSIAKAVNVLESCYFFDSQKNSPVTTEKVTDK